MLLQGQQTANFGMNTEVVHRSLPFLVSARHDSIDYTNMIPLLGAAVKDYNNRMRVGRVTLLNGASTVDVASALVIEFGRLVPMHGALVLTQNETGWGAVRGRVLSHDATAPTILIESANSASTDSVGYCVMLCPLCD